MYYKNNPYKGKPSNRNLTPSCTLQKTLQPVKVKLPNFPCTP